MLIGKLHIIGRTSYQGINGNPRYLCTIGGIECVTGVDSSLGYSITNHRDRVVRAETRVLRGKTTITSIQEVS